MTTPAEDFAAAIAPLLPRRPDPPADDLTADNDPEGDLAAAELGRIADEWERTGRPPEGWLADDDPADDAPRRPRPDKSQGSSANGGSLPPDPASTFAEILTSRLPGGRPIY